MRTLIYIISLTLYGKEREAQRLSNLTKGIQQIVKIGLGIRLSSCCLQHVFLIYSNHLWDATRLFLKMRKKGK